MSNEQLAALIATVVDQLDTPERRPLCPSHGGFDLVDELIILADKLNPPKEDD